MKSFFPATLLARKNGKVIILLEVRCDASRDLVPVVQFKNYEKHPWRKVISESVTPPWVFFTSLKFCKWYQIAQSVSDI